MRNLLVVTALAAVVPTLSAQDQKPAGPKTKAHEALAMFVGDWDTSIAMAQEQPTTGHEHGELICDGLFLKATIDGSFGGAPFQGVFLIGYDSKAQHYTGHWVDSMDCAPSLMTAQYDEAKQTWRWSGTTAQGRMRSELALQKDGSLVEHCWQIAADGKETPSMTITRKRHEGAVAARAASVPMDAKLSAEHKLLLQDVGDWTAAVKVEFRGMQPMQSQATERATSICGGHWTWTDYRGEQMGQPFDGHALTGYDPATKEYIGFWFDSGSATPSATRGTFDAAGKVLTMRAETTGPGGKPRTMTKVLTHTDANARTLRTEFAGGAMSGSMETVYTRAAK